MSYSFQCVSYSFQTTSYRLRGRELFMDWPRPYFFYSISTPARPLGLMWAQQVAYNGPVCAQSLVCTKQQSTPLSALACKHQATVCSPQLQFPACQLKVTVAALPIAVLELHFAVLEAQFVNPGKCNGLAAYTCMSKDNAIKGDCSYSLHMLTWAAVGTAGGI